MFWHRSPRLHPFIFNSPYGWHWCTGWCLWPSRRGIGHRWCRWAPPLPRRSELASGWCPPPHSAPSSRCTWGSEGRRGWRTPEGNLERASSYCLPLSPPGRDRSRRERPPEEIGGRRMGNDFFFSPCNSTFFISLLSFQHSLDELGRAQTQHEIPAEVLNSSCGQITHNISVEHKHSCTTVVLVKCIRNVITWTPEGKRCLCLVELLNMYKGGGVLLLGVEMCLAV